jgi:hypothetical protein
MIHEVAPGIIDSPEINQVCIYLKGLNEGSVNTECTTRYHCVRGEVLFFVYNKGRFYSHWLTAGQGVTIPANTPYVDYSPHGVNMLAISKPAFDSQKVIYLPPHPTIQRLFGLIDS